MDRRRFVPRPEGLETRELMAAPSVAAPAATARLQATAQPRQNSTQSDLAELIAYRIDHVPGYLSTVQPDRYVPKSVTRRLQANLTEIAFYGLKPAPSWALQIFNEQLRGIFKNPSLSASNSQMLNRSFGKVLSLAGARNSTIKSFQRTMLQLTDVDIATQASYPSRLVANDYALMLQMALALGRDGARLRAQGGTPARR